MTKYLTYPSKKKIKLVSQVTIIITVFNNSKFLRRCLESINLQSYKVSEIILIDDGSKDNEAEKMIKKYVLKKLNFNFIKQKSSPSKARNFGLNKVKSKYFIFFDPDDVMLKNLIKNKIKIFNKKKDPKLIGVYSNAILKTDKTERKFKYKKNFADENNIDSIGYENGISGSLPTYLFQKDKISNFFLDNNLKINEDFDFIIRLLKNKKKVFGSGKYDSIIYLEKNSLTRKKSNKFLIYKNQIKFLKKAKKNKYFSETELTKRDCSIYADRKIILPNIYLPKVDRTSMQYSIEARVPFLDNELFSLMSSVSLDSLTAGGVTKSLLRDTLKGIVPDAILNGKKKGFGVPIGEWMKRDLGELLLELAPSCPLLNADIIKIELEKHRKGIANLGLSLYKLLILSCWYKRYQYKINL